MSEIDLNYTEANSYWNTGRQLWKGGYVDEAENCFSKAKELYQDLIERLLAIANSGKLTYLANRTLESPLTEIRDSEKQRQEAAKSLNQGKQLEQEGQLEQAIECFQQAIQLDPNLPWSYHSLGDALSNQGQLDAAINYYCECIRLSPETPWSYHALGDVLMRKEKTDEAIAFYQWALRINPDLYWTHNALGNIFCYTGQCEQAEHHYQQAIRIDPHLEAARLGLDSLRKQLQTL